MLLRIPLQISPKTANPVVIATNCQSFVIFLKLEVSGSIHHFYPLHFMNYTVMIGIFVSSLTYAGVCSRL